MKWLIKNEQPKHGDYRTTYKFAWVPTVVKEYKVWLEFYTITECYYEPRSGGPGWWTGHSTDFAVFYD